LIRAFRSPNGIYKIEVNDPLPSIDVEFLSAEEINSNELLSKLGLRLEVTKDNILIEKRLDIRDHVVGLGEKAFELDRKRYSYVMYNVDARAYGKFSDPLYLNIPFFIVVRKGEVKGYFINSASKLIIDVGYKEYDKLRVIVPEESVEFYVIEGKDIEEIIEKYTSLTGKPFLPPKWAFGYMISRYSYFPQDRVVEIVKEFIREGFKVSGVFLDIHYMDNFKLFTWNPERFPEPKKMIEELHSLGVKVITIVDHGIRVDQNYEVFKQGLGKYCETREGEIFTGKLWPGIVVYPDFFREDVREWWAELIAKWLSQGVDGIWLDMNEPTDFSRYLALKEFSERLGVRMKEDRFLLTFPDEVVHVYKGKRVEHRKVRNAYPLYQAMATFEGFRKAKRDEAFILSRSGYAGIQKYAFIWTGDNTPSWEDLKLQLQLVLGLSISGVPFVGIDIGGFQGRSPLVDNSLELLVRYYQLALFFPLFRTHKSMNGIDIEPIFLPSYYKEKVKRVIETRYKFLPYLYSLALEAHEKGHPILRPLFYEFNDDEYFKIEDEFFVGKHILYAPLLTREDKRNVILPKGNKWYDFFGNRILKEEVVKNSDELPIYIRENSIVPLDDEIIVFGKEGKFKIYNGTEVILKDNEITFSSDINVNRFRIITEEEVNKVLINGEEVKFTKDLHSIIVETKGKAVRKVMIK